MQNRTHNVRQLGEYFLTFIRQESLWIPAGRILALLASVFAVRLLTEWVAPEQYGRLALVTGLISLVSLVLYTSLGKSANRFVWDYVNQQNGDAWIAAVIISYLFLGLVFTVFLWGALLFGIGVGVDGSIAVWAIPIFLIAGALSTGVLSMLNMLHEYRTFVVGTVVYAWLTPGLAVGLVILVAPTAESILVGYAFAAFLMAIAVMWIIVRRRLLRFGQSLSYLVSLLLKLMRYAAPFMLVSLFYWIQITANRYVLDLRLGVEQVGIFVVAVAVARVPIQSVESVFGQVHQPRLFERIGQQNGCEASVLVRRQAFSDYMAVFLISTLPILCFTVLGAKTLMYLLAGQEFWTGAAIVPWVAMAEFLRAFVATVSMAFEVERRPRSLVVPIAIASLITLTLTYLLTSTVGVLGAGVALTVGTLVWLALIWVPASHLACWQFSWRSLLIALLIGNLVAGAAWLVAQLIENLAANMQSILFILVFALGYFLFAGRRLLGYSGSTATEPEIST